LRGGVVVGTVVGASRRVVDSSLMAEVVYVPAEARNGELMTTWSRPAELRV
jgi:hypothetical protein